MLMLQNVGRPGVLRVGIKMTTEQQHHFKIQAEGTAEREAVLASLRHSKANRLSHLILLNHLEQRRREIGKMLDHLIFEVPDRSLLEDLYLLGANLHQFTPLLILLISPVPRRTALDEHPTCRVEIGHLTAVHY